MQSLLIILLAFFLTFSLSIVSCERGSRSSNNQGGRRGVSGNGHNGPRQNALRFTSSDFCPGAGFSEEQKEQIKNLSQERNNQNLSREERRTARGELQKKILEEVAKTEEEKTALSKCFEQRRERKKRSATGSIGD